MLKSSTDLSKKRIWATWTCWELHLEAPLENAAKKQRIRTSLGFEKELGWFHCISTCLPRVLNNHALLKPSPQEPSESSQQKNHALQLILTPKILGPTDLLWTILFGESSLQTSNPNTDNGILTRLALFSNFDPQSPALKKWKVGILWEKNPPFVCVYFIFLFGCVCMEIKCKRYV